MVAAGADRDLPLPPPRMVAGPATALRCPPGNGGPRSVVAAQRLLATKTQRHQENAAFL